jgi:hypothetical protein
MSRPENDQADGGFLSRWARRKQEAKAAPVAEPPSQELSAEAQPVAPPEPEIDLPLPSLDDVVAGGDVSAFFGRHVPEALRTAALRKLWVTDPIIRDFIEMADYQWDFNNPDSIPGWSSKLGDVDVKAMADRILNFVAKPESSPEVGSAPSGPAEPDVPASGGDVREIPDYSSKSETSAAPATFVEDASRSDVAVQNNPSSSSGYATVRKRGGGALPT